MGISCYFGRIRNAQCPERKHKNRRNQERNCFATHALAAIPLLGALQRESLARSDARSPPTARLKKVPAPDGPHWQRRWIFASFHSKFISNHQMRLHGHSPSTARPLPPSIFKLNVASFLTWCRMNILFSFFFFFNLMLFFFFPVLPFATTIHLSSTCQSLSAYSACHARLFFK